MSLFERTGLIFVGLLFMSLVIIVVLALVPFFHTSEVSPSQAERTVLGPSTSVKLSPWEQLHSLWRRLPSFHIRNYTEADSGWTGQRTESRGIVSVWTMELLTESQVWQQCHHLRSLGSRLPVLLYTTGRPNSTFEARLRTYHVRCKPLSACWKVHIPLDAAQLCLLALLLTPFWKTLLWWDLNTTWLTNPDTWVKVSEAHKFWSSRFPMKIQTHLAAVGLEDHLLPEYHISPHTFLFQRSGQDDLLWSALQAVQAQLHVLLPAPHDNAAFDLLALTCLHRGQKVKFNQSLPDILMGSDHLFHGEVIRAWNSTLPLLVPYSVYATSQMLQIKEASQVHVEFGEVHVMQTQTSKQEEISFPGFSNQTNLQDICS